MSFARRGRWFLVIGAAGLVVVPGAAQAPGTAQAEAAPVEEVAATPVVSFDAATDLGTVNRELFGANHRYHNIGSGMFNADTLEPYPAFVQQSKDAGVSIVRFPGGTVANTYHWRRAIGPQEERRPNLHGGGFAGPSDNMFGPDEFGAYIEQIGASGALVVNAADGTPKEAADFVEYMTAPAGSGELADLRAANGHPAPYDIRYVEVANEPMFDFQYYWRSGEVVEFNNPSCQAHVQACLYAYGGTTHFTEENVGRFADFREDTNVGDGSTRTFYLRYPQAVPGTVEVFVDGQETTAFTLNAARWAVVFDEPPANGQVITASYDSGPHKGMVDFYDSIKVRNPNIPVCSSFDERAFYQVTSGDNRFDCGVHHAYSPDNPPGATCSTPEEFFGPFVLSAQSRRNDVQKRKNWINTYAGGRGVELILSEYGHLKGDNGPACEDFHMSLGEGVFTGLLLRHWINEDIPMAMRHSLVDYVFGQRPPGSAGFGEPENAIIAGPGPDSVAQPQALVLNLFRHMTGPTNIETWVTDNPTRTLSDGRTLYGLIPVATRDEAGNAYLIVINQDPYSGFLADVAPQNFAGSYVTTAWTVSHPDLMAFNTAADPNNVRISKQTKVTSGGQLTRWFPAHSVTALRLTPGPFVTQWSFDQQTVGGPPQGWDVSGPAGNVTVQPDLDGSTGNVLRVTRDNGDLRVIAEETFTPQTGLVRVGMRVRAEQTSTPLGIQVLDADGAPVARVSLSDSGTLAWSDGGQWVHGPAYTAGQWQWLDLTLHQFGGVLKVHHNGELVGTAQLDGAGPAAAVRVLQRGNVPGGTVHLDDLVVN